MFQKAVGLNPNDHEAVGDLGDGYRASGDNAKAKAAYDQAIALALKALRVNPQDASTLGDVAHYYAKNGDSKKGLDFIGRARSIDANDNELMYKEAAINAMAGQQAEGPGEPALCASEGLFGGASQERSGIEELGYESRVGQADR